MFASQCPDVNEVVKIFTLIHCHDTLCVTQFSWWRWWTPRNEILAYWSGLISNQFRNFYSNHTLVVVQLTAPTTKKMDGKFLTYPGWSHVFAKNWRRLGPNGPKGSESLCSTRLVSGKVTFASDNMSWLTWLGNEWVRTVFDSYHKLMKQYWFVSEGHC